MLGDTNEPCMTHFILPPLQVSPIAITNIGFKFYLVFVCLNFADFIAIALFFPETKGDAWDAVPSVLMLTACVLGTGKTLEEMNQVFGDSIDAHQVLNDHGVKTHESEDEKLST